ncbi:GPW/gp25 family protein [Ottowia sp.]|uniref:GPW/gp25 family protein n=1 Tax=Ottowia sp. TaxID=1898956 RepID=UPI003A8AEF29
MPGMHHASGRALGGLAHLRQSVQDILTTPIGSRVMRRDYGSLVPALLDHPLNAAVASRISAAAVAAITRWEPRLLVQSAQLTPRTDADSGAVQPGRASILIEASVREVGTRTQALHIEVAL